ncbi:MAG TPA: dipeptide epimerase [Gammaproteobacteria bacterium]|nr:dipeptide epimerase [Gammaproteobacteria bacterium]
MNTDLEIRNITLHPLNVPLKASFDTATSRVPVIDNLAVAIELADGSRGWGEVPILHPVTTEDSQTALEILERESGMLTGENAGEWRRIANELLERLPGFAAVRCGLEMAVIDAFMRSRRIPLYLFFGGMSDSVNTDITIPICPANEARYLASQYKLEGFTIIKTKIGHDTGSDITRILAIKQAFSDCRLILDANTGYSVIETLEILAELRKADIVPDLLEQPLKREDWEGMGKLTREAGVPIAADESCRTPADAMRIAKGGLAHVINIKLAKCGVVQALDIVSIARSGDIGLMIGGMVETRIAMGFSAHFAAGLGGFDWIDLDTPLLLADDPVEGGYLGEGPCYRLNTGSSGHGGNLILHKKT